MKGVAIGALSAIALIVIAVTAAFFVILYQGKRIQVGDPQYVAMGSSFAAGIGLGKRASGSPIACMRTIGGYPSLVSEILGLPLVDVSCSGATTAHVLRGGQYFHRAQIDALTPRTRLVTITSGGNDIRYVADLSASAARNTRSVIGWIAKFFVSDPLPPSRRDYAKVSADLISFVQQVRRRAPHALVVIVTYPTILPPSGTCERLSLSADEVKTMRKVGERLAEATRDAAVKSGATLIDMQSLGVDHHACSRSPWVNGWIDADGTQFHPTHLGAEAMAQAIVQTVRPHL